MKKIKYIFIITLILYLNVHTVFSAYSKEEITGYLGECYEENAVGNPLEVGGGQDGMGTEDARDSRDYLCVSAPTAENVLNADTLLYNIILDQEFSDIDADADSALEILEDEKDYYFGPRRKAPFFQAPDDIEKTFGIGGEFYKRYYEKCDTGNPDGILGKTFDIIEKGSGRGIIGAKDMFGGGDCMALAVAKLEARKGVAYDILTANKEYVRRDSKLLYEQPQRGAYDGLFRKIVTNIGYLTEVAQKWANKTKKTY